MSTTAQLAELRRQIEMRTVGLGWRQFETKWSFFQEEKHAAWVHKQHRARTGMFAPSPTDNDAKLLRMYTEAFNPRLVAALVDHRWDQLMLEGDESGCAVCSCMPWVTACCS